MDAFSPLVEKFKDCHIVRTTNILGQGSYGVVIAGSLQDPQILLEYMSGGTLLQYIKARRRSARQLISICRNIVCGMVYLHDQQFIHRDLAARNILISENGTAKISDFGSCVKISNGPLTELTDYDRKEIAHIPLRWSPKEGLPQPTGNGKYSLFTDVWAFGVLLWEVFSRGNVPYSLEDGKLMSDEEVVDTLNAGSNPNDVSRVELPHNLGILFSTIFTVDWEARPQFYKLRVFFEDALSSTNALAVPRNRKISNTKDAISGTSINLRTTKLNNFLTEEKEIKVRKLAKILCADGRLRKGCLLLAGYLDIRGDDATCLKRNVGREPLDVIQATLEYWMSIKGEKATVRELSSVLRKKSFSYVVEKLDPYLDYRTVFDYDIKPFKNEEMSTDLDDLLDKISGMNVDQDYADGFSVKDTIVIDGMKDFGSVKDKKFVQQVLDHHQHQIKVVDTKRFQGRNKHVMSLKVKLKAKDKAKSRSMKLIPKIVNDLTKMLSRHMLTVSEFNPDVVQEKQKTSSFPSRLGEIARMAHWFGFFSRISGNNPSEMPTSLRQQPDKFKY